MHAVWKVRYSVKLSRSYYLYPDLGLLVDHRNGVGAELHQQIPSEANLSAYFPVTSAIAGRRLCSRMLCSIDEHSMCSDHHSTAKLPAAAFSGD
jgi:hypothetical protein